MYLVLWSSPGLGIGKPKNSKKLWEASNGAVETMVVEHDPINAFKHGERYDLVTEARRA